MVGVVVRCLWIVDDVLGIVMIMLVIGLFDYCVIDGVDGVVLFEVF